MWVVLSRILLKSTEMGLLKWYASVPINLFIPIPNIN